jgi:transposase
MPHQGAIVGIDIAKAKVDACIRGQGLRCMQPSTPEGEAGLIEWLRRHQAAIAVMEASGGYERRWAAALRQAGIAVRVVDPKRVRHFAKSAGRLAKNDPIDAEMIAWFGETFSDAPAQAADPAREELDQLVTARAAVVKLRSQLRNRQEHRQPEAVRQAFAAITQIVEAQRAALEAAITAKLAAVEAWAEPAAIIDSVPGLGKIATAGLIAWMPELGRIGDKAAAALLGLAPYDDDSGGRTGERHIKGGRGKLRELLYVPLVGAATQHNPVLNACYKRLRAKGKPFKAAIIACMRKLIVILNTMLARGQCWNPPATAVAPATAPPRGGCG